MGENIEHNDSRDYYPKGTYVHQRYYHKAIKKLQVAKNYSEAKRRIRGIKIYGRGSGRRNYEG